MYLFTELLYLPSMKALDLFVLPQELCVTRLPPDAKLPGWSDQGGFCSITRTRDELSIVCEPVQVPDGFLSEPGWRAIEVKGPMQFSEVGILAGLTQPLARTGISIFVISTYDTDYILVKADDVRQAVDVLRTEGHRVDN